MKIRKISEIELEEDCDLKLKGVLIFSVSENIIATS